MTILTNRTPLSLAPRGWQRQPSLLGQGADLARIGALALLVAVAAAMEPALVIGACVGVATGTLDGIGELFLLGAPLLWITIPVMALWFLSAVATRRAIERLGGINAGDRVAFWELHRLLDGQ
jgi:hypothetical protein